MLLEDKGFTIDIFYITPLKVDKGEILTIKMFGGAHFFPHEKNLRTYLLAKKTDSVTIDG